MRHQRETLPAAGTPADEDLRASFSYEELVRDVAKELGDQKPPSREEGWLTILEIQEMSESLTVPMLRRKLVAMVRAGKYERIYYKTRFYYRRKPAEGNGDEVERAAAEI